MVTTKARRLTTTRVAACAPAVDEQLAACQKLAVAVYTQAAADSRDHRLPELSRRQAQRFLEAPSPLWAALLPGRR